MSDIKIVKEISVNRQTGTRSENTLPRSSFLQIFGSSLLLLWKAGVSAGTRYGSERVLRDELDNPPVTYEVGQKEALLEIANRLQEVEAVCLLVRSGAVSGYDHKQVLLDQYGIAESDVGTLLPAKDEISLSEVAEVLKAYSESSDFNDVPLLDSSGSDINRDPKFWTDFIIKKKLTPNLLYLGSSGKRVLKNLEIDASAELYRLAKENYQEAQVNMTSGIRIISPRGSDDKLIALGGDLYHFDESVPDVNRSKAQFVLQLLSNITEMSGPESDISRNEVSVFYSWIYEDFANTVNRRTLNLGSDSYRDDKSLRLSLTEFRNNIVDQLKDGKRGNGIGDLLNKLSVIVDDISFGGGNYAIDLISDAIAGDVNALTKIVSCLKPKTKLMFNTSSSLNDKNIVKSILVGSFENESFNPQNISRVVKEYTGRLSLERIEDWMASNIDESDRQDRAVFSQQTMDMIMSGKMPLSEWADRFFGVTNIAFVNPDGELEGRLVTNKVAQVTSEFNPENREHYEMLIKILYATEGAMFESGDSYLKQLIERNIKNIAKNWAIDAGIANGDKMPLTGASVPPMTIWESIMPGIFDELAAIAENKNGLRMFHRPDLYGKLYAKRIYTALLNGKPFDDIYEFNDNSVTNNADSSALNKIISKLETTLFVRDYAYKFGLEEFNKVLVKYVPISLTLNGIQICGFEKAANYFFDKPLKDVDMGEMAILVGMIQAPVSYSPDLGGEGVNRNATLNRALYVMNLFKKECGKLNIEVDFDKMRKQIEKYREGYFRDFARNIDATWLTTTKELDTLAKEGALRAKRFPLVAGLAVVRTDMATPINPEVEELMSDPRQKQMERWFESLFISEKLTIETHEQSPIAKVLQKIESVILAHYEGDQTLSQLASKIAEAVDEITKDKGGFRYENAIKDHNDKGRISKNKVPEEYTGDIRARIWTDLYQLETVQILGDRKEQGELVRSTNIYQCGQLVLLMNHIVAYALNDRIMPEFKGGAEDWIAPLGAYFNRPGLIGEDLKDKDQVVEQGYLYKRLDHMKDEDVVKEVQTGDMIVSWVDHWGGGGHVSYVVDACYDPKGERYFRVLDANFDSLGSFRSQLVRGKDLNSTIFPGRLKHKAIIRSLKITDHGQQVKIGETVLNTLDQVKIDGHELTIPEFGQSDKPAVIISTYNGQSLEASANPTGVLGSVPIIPGNSLKPFVLAFLADEGVSLEAKQDLFPGNFGLDDRGVANSAVYEMNASSVAQASLLEAIAIGADVPIQKAFKELFDQDPGVWNRFQDYLDFWGIKLTDQFGNPLADPEALAPIGRGVYVKDAYSLGYALNCFVNAERTIGENCPERARFIKSTKKITYALLDSEKRETFSVYDKLIKPYITHDKFDTNAPNVTTDFGDVVSVGTRNWGVSDMSLVLLPESDGRVRVALAYSQPDRKGTNLARTATVIPGNSGALVPMAVSALFNE